MMAYMGEPDEHRLVLDERRSLNNLPVALLPASVGLLLIAYPWFGALDPAVIAPIMIPFGVVWLVLALCISAYHSDLYLDHDRREVVYHNSLLLHSWTNKAAAGNVSRVLLEPVAHKFHFVMEVVKGEDLTVTTGDYWQCREWAAQVAVFLEVPLVDATRAGEELDPDQLRAGLRGQLRLEGFPQERPGRIEVKWHNEQWATITLPSRGLGRSQFPRVGVGLVALLAGVAGGFQWGFPVPVLGLAVALWAWWRPLARATHHELLKVSPNGLVASVTMLGRSRRTTISSDEIREISVVEGREARFEHTDFDRFAVCLETPERHLQLGAHLATQDEVEWLHRALLFLLTQESSD